LRGYNPEFILKFDEGWLPIQRLDAIEQDRKAELQASEV